MAGNNMACGNQEHFENKNIFHTCVLCIYWDINIHKNIITKEPCITCKQGDCQFTHIEVG
jgi:hypothetical protein